MSDYVKVLEDFNKKLEPFRKSTKDIEDEYRGLIVDPNIPLEERWKLFCEFPIKVHSNYYLDCIRTFNISPYDDWYVEKYETVDVQSMIEDSDEDEEDCGFSFKYLTDEQKEIILKCGYNSFCYDW